MYKSTPFASFLAFALAWGATNVGQPAFAAGESGAFIIPGAHPPVAAGTQPSAGAKPKPDASGARQDRKEGTREKTAAGPLSPKDVAELRTKLESSEPEEIEAAIQAIAEAGPRATALSPALEGLIRRGSRLDLVTAAIEALGSIGRSSSSEAILPFVHHRDAVLRRTAVRALGRMGGANAVAALRGALSDVDPAVRSFSAASLGSLRAKEATADLFEALDRGIFDAANAIGRICSVDQCQRFATRIEKLPLSVYTSGIEPMLFRPGSEIPEETKAHLVQKLRDLGTIEVHRYLRDLLSRWPKEGSMRVRQAMMGAISATIGAER